MRIVIKIVLSANVLRIIIFMVKVFFTFAPWVGALMRDTKQQLLLVTPNGKEEEAVTRLARIGFDNSIGFLDGGFEAWKKATKEYDTISSINMKTFGDVRATLNDDVPLFDVRKKSEFDAEHVVDAENTSLNYINDHLSLFPKDKSFYLYCDAGYRSVIAASILKSRGIHNLFNIADGFDVIKKTDIPVTDYVCPTTLL